jgi:hypothetical protein
LTTTIDPYLNELETTESLVRHLDFRIIKADEGLGGFELLGLLERFRLFVFLFAIFSLFLPLATCLTSYSLPSFKKDELTINGLVASNFLALCSTLLLLVFFGVIFLVAIFAPLFSFF